MLNFTNILGAVFWHKSVLGSFIELIFGFVFFGEKNWLIFYHHLRKMLVILTVEQQTK